MLGRRPGQKPYTYITKCLTFLSLAGGIADFILAKNPFFSSSSDGCDGWGLKVRVKYTTRVVSNLYSWGSMIVY